MPTAVVDPRTGAVRGVRALVLAGVAVGVAGAAHTFVDGCVDAVGLLLSLGVCWPMAVALLGRRRRVAALLLWCSAAQVATHVVVSLTCGGAEHGAPTRVLLTHGAAVVVSAALLAHGDHGLWLAHALRRTTERLTLPSTPAVAVPEVRRASARSRPARAPRQLWQVSPLGVRGPPSALLPTS